MLLLLISLYFFVFFWGGETSGLKSKMLQQTRDNVASTHMKSTGNKNCLTKLHLSRNDNESLKTNTRKKGNYHRHQAASEEKWIPLARRFTATNHEARWCPRSKKINFSSKWWNWRIPSVGRFSILHALFQSLFLRRRQTRFPSHFPFLSLDLSSNCNKDIYYQRELRTTIRFINEKMLCVLSPHSFVCFAHFWRLAVQTLRTLVLYSVSHHRQGTNK